ncbi:glycosyltransferase family 4 protein [Polynucleobacter paneuropaeus]|nr:glycosyltransferase family 4 protein [Polynucleobacter paneuropaeus]
MKNLSSLDTSLEFFDLPSYPSTQVLFSVPPAIFFIATFRSDLASLNLSNLNDRISLYDWWVASGASVYVDCSWEIRAQEIEYLDSIDLREKFKRGFGNLSFLLKGSYAIKNLSNELVPFLNEEIEADLDPQIKIPRFLTLLIGSRDDLKALFNVSTFNGLLAAIKWWETGGRDDVPSLVWDIGNFFLCMNEEIEADIDPQIKIPRFLTLLIGSRDDLKALFNVSTFNGLLAAIKWWETGGRDDVPSLVWDIGNFFLCMNEEIEADIDPQIKIPRFLTLLIGSRDDLKALFNVSTFNGLLAAIKWWDAGGCNEYLNFRWNTGRITSLATKMNRGQLILDKGVDVVGYGQGILGVGEDARMAYLSLEVAGFPVSLISPPIAGPQKVLSTKNFNFNNIQTKCISIFTLPPQEMMRMATEGGRYFFSRDLYKIGAWPWELSFIPDALKYSELLVNEVWAQSSYVYKALSTSLTVPIIKMPMAVSIPAISKELDRGKFNLPEESFIFFTVFDGNSWLKRKNPMAVVTAFQKAFPKSQKDVSLVIKAMNVEKTHVDWIRILKIAESDSRVLIVNEVFSKKKLIDFMSLCDAFVSLHRSEGFGRSIAEAMLLGKPVIASNYSGNLDFCDQENSYLVDGEIISLRKDDYPYGEMQCWFDPATSSAASQMRKILDDREAAYCKSQKAKNNIIDKYSIEAVAKKYKERLDKILLKI